MSKKCDILFILEYDGHCDSYHPPLRIECFQQLWKDKAKCTDNGLRYPTVFKPVEYERLWRHKNLR